MAAHARVMLEADGSKRLVTFTTAERGRDSAVKILELDEAGAKVRRRTFENVHTRMHGARACARCVTHL